MEMKNILATCDAGCKKEFTITKFKTKKVKNGIEKTFFRCTNCKHEYVAYYSSAETLKLQKEMRQMQVKMRTGDINNLLKEEALIKAKVKQSMDDARRIAEG
jgi:DNA replicative helicase MCM subunit Mcm2 (Cdc46/Mcm family)